MRQWGLSDVRFIFALCVSFGHKFPFYGSARANNKKRKSKYGIVKVWCATSGAQRQSAMWRAKCGSVVRYKSGAP